MTQNQVDQSSMKFMGEVEQLHKGSWIKEEDERLIYFVQLMGDKKWDSLAKASGLRRSGKSCRLRWLNYLRPNLKRGRISVEEENIILQLHEKWGNKWSKIARRLPGRTDNEIKNYWRSCLRKKNNSNIVAQQSQESHEEQNNEGKEELLLYDENKNESITTSSPSDNKHEHDISCEDWISSSSSSSSEFELANSFSPYEDRFKDWVSKYYSLNDQQQSEVNNQNESCNNNSVDDESCWSNSLDYNSSCTWEYSGSLWDLN